MNLLLLSDLRYLEITYTEDGIIMIKSSSMKYHMSTEWIMEHINIFHIFSYITSLDMIILQIRHSHNNHIRIHLHHKSDKSFLAYIISSDMRILFFHFKDLIVGITRYIMYCNISMLKKILNCIFKIFIEAVFL